MRNPRTKLLATAAVLGSAAALALALLPAGRDLAQSIEQVLVANFPEVQRVSGEVRVPEPIRHSRFDLQGEVLVPPVGRDDSTQLITGEVLETDGFSRVVVSLFAEVKGRVLRPGQAGAILIPDEAPVLTAFREESLLAFPLEVAAPVTSASAYVSSEPRELTVAFPRYRVYFYNTSDRTVGVHLYGYLTH
jgi:hypothetical protein